MKTVGIIGGIGPESTIEYYRLMLSVWRERVPDGSAPSIVINSIDLQKALRMIEADEWGGMVDYVVQEIGRLSRAGADFGLLSANTPHMVFDEIRSRASLPLISIVEATCEAARAKGLNRLGLFGTRFTMQARFYQDVFLRAGMTLVVPGSEDQAYIHDKYMNELVRGTFLEETKGGLMTIARRMKDNEAIDGLILGGTELPLILRDEGDCGIPFLDTTRIHVNAAVERMLA